ncbi:filamentous hemagglutinin N-terminal domain-containing protein [Leptolyngbyaceae cyanobacterium UHCC 1019]
MAQTWHWHPASTAIVSFGLAGLCFTAIPSSAQIAPDQTLGTESSSVLPNATVRGLPADLIQGGATRGVNLFHSFSQFNVRDGQRVYFANPVGIETILSRVTGANPSRIFGTLGVNGTANLFLINPNGILFGPNARLDVAGSFLASTANSFRFPDGSEFSATNPQAPPLLTVNIRPGLQYGLNHQATIANAGNLTAGKDLTLAAGNLDLQGQLQSGGDLTLRALDTVKVRDNVTTPFIAIAGGKLTVQGDRAIDIFALNHPNSGFFSGGDLVLRSTSSVTGDAHYYAGGTFRIETLDGSPGNLFSPHDPVILAIGDVFVGNYTGESLHILAGGSVTLGDVNITGPGGVLTTINPNNPFFAALSRTPYGNIDGSTGSTLDVRAGIDWAALGGLSANLQFPVGAVNPFFRPFPTGSRITVGQISNGSPAGPNGPTFLTNNYFPNLALSAGLIEISRSIGTFGNVVIDSRGDIRTGAPSTPGLGSIDTSVSQLDQGVNGLRGVAGTIALLAGGSIDTTRGKLNSIVGTINQINGDIVLENGTAGNIILLSNGRIDTAALTSSVRGGQAGQIILGTVNGDIVTGDAVESYVRGGAGNGGEITINAGGSIITGGRISSFVNSPLNTGNGGNITLTSRSGAIDARGGYINSTTSNGNSGNITLSAFGNITTSSDFPNSNGGTTPAIGSYIGAGGSGFAGQIALTSQVGTINTAAGTLNSATPAAGVSGDISLTAAGDIFAGNIRSFSTGANSGGNITVRSPSGSVVFNRSQINAQNTGLGFAGDIQIQAQNQIFLANGSEINSTSRNALLSDFSAIKLESTGGSVLLDQSRIIATNAGTGFAGDITISARDRVDILNNSTISSTGQFGRTLIGQSAATRNEFPNSVSPRIIRIADSTLNTSNSGTGRAGDIRLNASELISVANSNIFSKSNTTERSSSFGTVELIAAQGSILVDNVTLSTTNFDSGFAGDIVISGRDRVNLQNSDIFSRGHVGRILVGRSDDYDLDYPGFSPVAITITGTQLNTKNDIGAVSSGINVNAGDIAIRAINSISAMQSDLKNFTAQQGSAGDVSLITENRNGSIRLTDADVFSTVDSNGQGQGGTIAVSTGDLVLEAGSQLQALTRGSGNAGAIFIDASNSVEISGFNQFASALFVSSEVGARGNAGDIFVQTESLRLTDRGLISAATRSNFNAGNITLQVGRDIELRDHGLITVSGLSTGNPGNISITAGGSLIMKNGSAIQATTASGQNANIAIGVRGAIAMGCCDNEISAQARGVGNGGNISISALAIITFLASNNDIVANAEDGRGGNIFITSPFFKGSSNRGRRQGDLLKGGSVRVFREGKIRTLESDITASSEFGVDGIVDIPGENQFELLPQLPATFRDVTDLVTSKCSYGEKGRSRFVSTGRGGIASSPTDPLSDESVSANWVSVPATDLTFRTTTQTAVNQPLTEIVEAQGWVKEADGTIALVAYTPNAVPANSWLRSPECDEKRQVK